MAAKVPTTRGTFPGKFFDGLCFENTEKIAAFLSPAGGHVSQTLSRTLVRKQHRQKYTGHKQKKKKKHSICFGKKKRKERKKKKESKENLWETKLQRVCRRV